MASLKRKKYIKNKTRKKKIRVGQRLVQKAGATTTITLGIGYTIQNTNLVRIYSLVNGVLAVVSGIMPINYNVFVNAFIATNNQGVWVCNISSDTSETLYYCNNITISNNIVYGDWYIVVNGASLMLLINNIIFRF